MVRVDLTPDTVQRAVEAAKLARLRAEIGDAEVEGGAHSSEDVRVFVRKSLTARAARR